MERCVVIEKNVGETPLSALERLRLQRDTALSVPMTYAGRLDPMASGKLVILIGDECKRKDAYLSLDKEYEFEILFGVSSDTGDILGLVERDSSVAEISQSALKAAARKIRARLLLPYPAYSSKTVEGVPLFARAREGTLPANMPSKKVHIKKIAVEGLRTANARELLADIEQRLSLLKVGDEDENPYKDFRKDAVLARWKELLAHSGTYQIASMRATVSSGTYIRSLVPLIADKIGTQGLAYSIRRTRIGRYVSLWRERGVWIRSY